MNSLRKSLINSNLRFPVRIPSDFQTCIRSLAEIIRILGKQKPEIGNWSEKFIYSFAVNNAQGLVFAHKDIWFLSSEKDIFKCLIRGTDPLQSIEVKSLERKGIHELVCQTDLDPKKFDHIGDLGYFNGLLFAPLRHISNNYVLLLALNDSLEVIGYSQIAVGDNQRPPWISDAWCALNPFNNLLYMSRISKNTQLYAFDVSEFYNAKKNPMKWGKSVKIAYCEDKNMKLFVDIMKGDMLDGIQGCAFSRMEGLIFITWWTRHMGDIAHYYTNHLRVYNAFTGMLIGDKIYDFPGDYDEIEGISIHPSGGIYVAVSNNNNIETDEFEIYTFYDKNRGYGCKSQKGSPYRQK